jgi:hypothetical protein
MLGRRTRESRAERHEGDRAECVVGTDARELVMRDVLLQRGVPKDAEELDPDAGDERGRGDRCR